MTKNPYLLNCIWKPKV